ncbi:MAG TPA: caspase family protein [Polyangia bacterium]|jgi:hypothetical protein|nr:caspase family protein [Polyangia bacterium]
MNLRTLAAAAAAALLATGAAPPARAEIRRIAIVVGSNQGDASHAALRFAEQDAQKLSAVLGEIGGLASSDLILLRAPRLAEVRAALDAAEGHIADWHAGHHGQAILLFYYSGHSDGLVLELGREAMPFAELRRRLGASGADVRLVIVDSCRSGALLARKGGTLGQPFDIRLADDLGSTGEAFIASSAADEVALESAEIGASFFSHHFISGLRGAADLSGDGLVTLAEAYQYAFARTLRATSDTVVGPQHPAYDYQLAGRGDLVLTELRHPSATLDLPAAFDRLLLLATAGQQVLAELGPRSAHRIAVPAGEYQLRAWRGSQTFTARLAVAQGQERRVAMEEILPARALAGAVARKGADDHAEGEPAATLSARPPAPAPRAAADPWALSAAAGLAAGASGDLGDVWLGTLRVAVERRDADFQLTGALMLGTGRAASTRENRVAAEALPMWWAEGIGPVRPGAGIGVGAGAALQKADDGTLYWSGLAWASPTLTIQTRISRHVALDATVQVPVALLRRDDRFVASVLPAFWVGASRGF